MKTRYRIKDIEISNIAVFVELDNSTEARALFLNDSGREMLLNLITQGMFHDDSVTISDAVWQGLKFIKEK